MNCLCGPRQVWSPGHHVIPRNGDAHFFTVAQLALGISGVSFASLRTKKARPGTLDWFRAARAARTVRGLLQSSPQDAAVCSSAAP